MKIWLLKFYSKITKKSVYFKYKYKTYYIQPNGSIIIGIDNGKVIRGNRAKYIEIYEDRRN